MARSAHRDMHKQTIFNKKHWQLPEILFVVASCFAIGSSGFFLAVYLQLNTPQAKKPMATLDYRELPTQEKENMASSLGTSSPFQNSGNENAAAAVPQPGQVDERDPNAAAKLKMMRALAQ
jgi:hypothetical protein